MYCFSPRFWFSYLTAGAAQAALVPGAPGAQGIAPSVLEDLEDGSYLLPLSFCAVCEAQQVTEPMGGSHLSEQLKSCFRN